MAKLIYAAITSLDGFVADESGNFDWAEPARRSTLNPIVIGAGKPALPHDVRLPLELLDQHRFSSGVVCLRYRTAG